MSKENKSLVIIVLQYSVVVKGIEKKLTDAGYNISILNLNLSYSLNNFLIFQVTENKYFLILNPYLIYNY